MNKVNEDDIDLSEMSEQEIQDTLDSLVAKGVLIKHSDGSYDIKPEVRMTMEHENSDPKTRN